MKVFTRSSLLALLAVAALLLSGCRPPEIEGTVVNINKQLYDEAMVSAQSAIEKYPENGEAWFYWGWLNGERKKDYAEMNSAFDKAVKYGAATKVTLEGRSVVLSEAVKEVRSTKFAENYNSAVRLISKAQTEADETAKRSQFEEAREKLQTALVIAPDRLEPVRPLALTYLSLGDTTGAGNILVEGIKSHPQSEELLISAGEVYMKSGDDDNALAMFEKALAVNPKNSDVYQKLGVLEAGHQNWKKANEYYQKAIELEPDNADLSYNIGVSYYNQENFKEAIPYFKKSLATEPDNEVTYKILAGCYVRTDGMEDEAISFLEGATDKFPDDANLWEFLAITYGKKGMKDKADMAFKKSQEIKKSAGGQN